MCPLVWDNVKDLGLPPIAISRIFCGQIGKSFTGNMEALGFGASLFSSETGGYQCMYKDGIKDIPCYIVKGQRMLRKVRTICGHT